MNSNNIKLFNDFYCSFCGKTTLKKRLSSSFVLDKLGREQISREYACKVH